MSTAIVSMVAHGKATGTTDVAVDEILRDIKSDKWKVAIDHIRAVYQRVLAETNDAQQAKKAVADLKLELAGVMFSGRFSSRM